MEKMARLSLSGRLIEMQYRTCEMSVPEFLRFAHKCGYDAVELRATQIPAEITLAEVTQFRQMADELGLGISCCTSPRVTANKAGLERLKEFIGLAQALRCATLKVWIGEVDWMRQACDLLRPQELTLAVQVHTGGPFETLDSCLATLAQLDRKNFGLIYDPANLFEAQQDYGEATVKRLGPHIHQLSVQSVRPARPDEPDVWEHEGRYYRRCLLGDSEGLDYASVFRGLRAIGFDGYVTVNEPKPTLMEREAFAKRTCNELRKLRKLL